MTIRKSNTTGLQVYDDTGKTVRETVIISPRERLEGRIGIKDDLIAVKLV